MSSAKYKPTGKREKRLSLSQAGLVNFDTGRPVEKKFVEVNELFTKSCMLKRLNKKIRTCRDCPEMNLPSITESAPGYGNPNADIFFVGQSLCTACMSTKIPFTKGSGYFIDAALALSGLSRRDVFISNIVHCHPPRNRKSTKEEVQNCLSFVYQEIMIVEPDLIICLGLDAACGITKLTRQRGKNPYRKEPIDAEIFRVKHPAYFLRQSGDGIVNWIIDLSMEMDKWIS